MAGHHWLESAESSSVRARKSLRPIDLGAGLAVPDVRRLSAPMSSSVGGSLARGMWALQRFGLSPEKLPARVLNRSQPKVLCVSIPKSGTHLIERALCLHPRLYRRVLPTVKSANLHRWGDLDRLLAPLRPGQVVMAHLPYEPDYPKITATRGISPIFVIRDPRDVVVSEAHYLAANRSHRLHALFSGQATLKDMVLLNVRGNQEHGVFSIGEKLGRYRGWLDSGALVVRFEDLIGEAGGGDDAAQLATLRAIFEHIGLPPDDGFLARLGPRLFSRRSPTFRKGAIGAWRESFDQEVLEAFEESAGPYLEPYGYAHAR